MSKRATFLDCKQVACFSWTLSGSRRKGLPLKPIPPTATSSLTTAVASTTATTIFPWLGLAHNEPPPLVFAVMESVDRCLSLGVRFHLDKTEPLAATRVTVLDNVGALHCAERCEPLLQIR